MLHVAVCENGGKIDNCVNSTPYVFDGWNFYCSGMDDCSIFSPTFIHFMSFAEDGVLVDVKL